MRRLQSGGIPAGRRQEPMPRVSLGMVQSQQRIHTVRPYTLRILLERERNDPDLPTRTFLRRGQVEPEAVRERALRVGRGIH